MPGTASPRAPGPSCLAHQEGLARVDAELRAQRAATHPALTPADERRAEEAAAAARGRLGGAVVVYPPPAAGAAAGAAAAGDAERFRDPEECSEAPSEDDEQIIDPSMLEELERQGLVRIVDEGDSLADEDEAQDDVTDAGEAPGPAGPETASLVLAAHSKPVHCIALHPKEPGLCASGGEDDMGYLWRIEGQLPAPGAAAVRKPVAELKGHSDTVVAVAFSADGAFLATGGMDGRVLLWRPDGAHVATMEDLGDAVNFLFWHPRGNMLFAGGADSQSAMWNDRGVCLQLFPGHVGEVTCGCLSLDGKLLVTGSEDTSVKVFAPKTAEVVAQFSSRAKGMHELPTAAVRSLCPHGRNADIVCAGFDDGKVGLLGIAQKRVLQVLETGHTQAVEAIGFCPVQPYFATCCADGTLSFWNTDTHNVRENVRQDAGFVTLQWHQGQLFTADTSGSVKRWDGRGAPKPLQEWTGHSDTALCLTVSPAGDWVASGSDDHSLRVYDARAAPEAQ
eukprot:TRINITY_DN2028_c1_g1_i1.p1 TRINITY_DN2028_c1_g1~~TRINITY_DN2028_c1_g1_i1.p1  ORF type:complete len:507 (+),score=179.39 TRINITY_DN2028_c1_g1_i1:93-1613(+)